jgi:carboxypeptidase Taq
MQYRRRAPSELAAEIDDAFLDGPFDVDAQRDLSMYVLERMGFTREEWRLDPTVHPFCSSFATGDIRLTTRYGPSDLHSLFSSMHEFGHGIYENGVSPALERTPLGTGASMAVHESQSRLWENLVGRSLPFWRWAYPATQQAFPGVLGDVELERFLRAINRVRPSFIRVDADETTYGMHIILRFELERELLSGSLSLDDLPDAWNTRYAEYLGVDVPEDRVGVLQDIHWSGGMVGYFPSYQLGNVISVQIWEKLRAALPELDEQLERGEFGPLREWLRDTVYRHGRKFTTTELLERVVGGGIDPEPYLAYLRGKLGTLAPA